MATPFDLKIDTLKSAVSFGGGMSPKNRYYMILSPPAFLGGMLASGLTTTFGIFCESTGIPGRRVLTSNVQHQRQEIMFPYSFLDEQEVSFSFALPNNYYIKYFFDAWFLNIIEHEKYSLSYIDDIVGTINVIQLDQQNVPRYIAQLIRAYPISVDTIELTDNSQNDYQRMNVSFAYEHVRYPLNIFNNLITSGNLVNNTAISKAKSLSSIFNKSNPQHTNPYPNFAQLVKSSIIPPLQNISDSIEIMVSNSGINSSYGPMNFNIKAFGSNPLYDNFSNPYTS